MAKLYFYYSAMNAGKSTILLQSSYNYCERGMRTFLMCPQIDDRDEIGSITSRIGLSVQAHVFNTADNLFSCIEDQIASSPLHCVLVDEAQFLTAKQVRQLSDVCDLLDIPVLAYGIRTDFQAHLFEGSAELLAYADELTELKTICHCGRKATMNMRIDANGQPVRDGSQILIGGNDRYIAVCRRHFKEGLAARLDDDLPLLDAGDEI